MPDEPWTVERTLRTPRDEVIAALRRGDGPSGDVLREIVCIRLERQLRRIQRR